MRPHSFKIDLAHVEKRDLFVLCSPGPVCLTKHLIKLKLVTWLLRFLEIKQSISTITTYTWWTYIYAMVRWTNTYKNRHKQGTSEVCSVCFTILDGHWIHWVTSETAINTFWSRTSTEGGLKVYSIFYMCLCNQLNK